MTNDGWEEKLRRTITASGLSLNEIERETGVDHSALSRFMRGTRTLKFPCAERVGTFLGMKLVEPNPARTKKPKRP